MENMINLSESDNINWKNIKQKMTNEMQSNVHKLLSRMPNKERILFIKDFCNHFNDYINNKINETKINETKINETKINETKINETK